MKAKIHKTFLCECGYVMYQCDGIPQTGMVDYVMCQNPDCPQDIIRYRVPVETVELEKL